ncbi:MAG: glycosyltransferase involved in cell wall bioproteinis [Rhodocyclales bacterium]|nr:glycosyltransferase involved in cell wall bioproteinis [Rhodocyclales bacterium]
MNVVHINASDTSGGAARSCYRLHQFLLRHGVDSRLLVQQKRTFDPSVELVASPVADTELVQNIDLVQRVFSAQNRTDISNTYFSISLAGPDLCCHPMIEAADIIHLHWIASMQTPADIQRLMALGKPMVWTLHDLRPLTGGCHFPAGCSKFQDNCTNCPQLRCDHFDFPAAALRDQIELIDATCLTVIAPSHWIAEQAQLSAMLGDKARIEYIPNGVDVDIFAPRSRTEARAALGLVLDGTYILFGADQTKEKRKGFESLARVLGEATQDPRFINAGARVLWVGEPPAGEAFNDIPLIQLGRIPQEERMALAFAASDLFVLPSLEDNLPNMLLEALCCGTPTVAYSIGGIPDILHDEVNGRLVPAGDERKFAEALLSLVDDAQKRTEMGQRGRAMVSEQFSSLLQAVRHIGLYDELIQSNRLTKASLQSKHQSPAHCIRTPGPAVGALLEPLTIHCLMEEVRTLQTRVQKDERICIAQSQRIDNLQRELDARQQVIQDLQVHWLRAEDACVARLNVIDQLESHRQRLEAFNRELAAASGQLEEKEMIIRELSNAISAYRTALRVFRYPLRVLLGGQRLISRIKHAFIDRMRPRLGNLYQHPPRSIYLPTHYRRQPLLLQTPKVSIVTPSFGQGDYIGRTIESVLGQQYPNLEYFVQDGGSEDGTGDILRSYQDRLSGWESKADHGQSNAINLGFSRCTGEVMAWINSDDILLPGTIHAVIEYFNRHPDVDVVYGNRLLIDENDFNIGRWILPGHDPKVLSWADYIPQETLFWRRRVWEKIGGRVDEKFKFAMDWDLLIRFREAGARFAHIPRFLGAFRIHKYQKTSAVITDIGHGEMDLIRARLFGRVPTHHEIRKALFPFLLRHLWADYFYRIRKCFQRGKFKFEASGIPSCMVSDCK